MLHPCIYLHFVVVDTVVLASSTSEPTAVWIGDWRLGEAVELEVNVEGPGVGTVEGPGVGVALVVSLPEPRTQALPLVSSTSSKTCGFCGGGGGG